MYSLHICARTYPHHYAINRILILTKNLRWFGRMTVEEFIQRLPEVTFLNFAICLAWLYKSCIYSFLCSKRDVLFDYILCNFVLYLKMREPTYMVRPCPKYGRRKITQNSIEVDAETKESTRKTEEKLDGRYNEGHEWKKPKWRPVGR